MTDAGGTGRAASHGGPSGSGAGSGEPAPDRIAGLDSQLAYLLDDLPVLPESRERLREAARGGGLAQGVHALEADPVLALRALRLANSGPESAGTVGTVPAAVEALGAQVLAALAESVPVASVLDQSDDRALLTQRFRLHAVAVRGVAERLASLNGVLGEHELVASALLHDIGALALTLAGEAPPVDGTPEERLAAERAGGGIDHARLGGLLAHAWRLPRSMAYAIAAHHDAQAGQAALVRLADILSHYAHGRPVDLGVLVAIGAEAGIGREKLSFLMYELPHPISGVTRTIETCPLSGRELEILRLVSEGGQPKTIAHELGLSPKTVRNHLHRIYARLDVADRTQAVLIAREHNWV